MRQSLRILATFLMAGLGGCTGLPFHPERSVSATPATFGLSYKDVRIRTEDGETLSGWFIPAAQKSEMKPPLTLLFFHGNAGNISHRLDSLLLFHQLGLSQLIIDYRGFGTSTGKPSVNGTILDAQAAWNWLVTAKKLPPDQIILFGRSLGGGVAAALAARVTPKALILESTFTSLYDVGKDMFPWLPVSLFIPQDYDTPGNLKNVRIPLLVVHSPDDELVDYALGKALYDSYAGPKQFLRLHGPHNTGHKESGKIYTEGLSRFLNGLRQEKAKTDD